MKHSKSQKIKAAICLLAALNLLAGILAYLTVGDGRFSDIGNAVRNDSPYEAIQLIDTKEYDSYSAVSKSIKALTNAFPKLLRTQSAGTSVQGRSLWMLKMGTGTKKALVLGGIHAREHLTTKYLLRCIETYCNAYYSKTGMLGSYNIRSLLKTYTLYIIPCINPDGLEIILSLDTPAADVGIPALSEYKANANGVDLNRNFPLAWEELSNGVTSPYAYYFKGYSAASEPETQAVMTLCRQNRFAFALSIHIRGDCIYWGDEYDTSLNEQYYAFAKKLGDATGIALLESTSDVSLYAGGFENWFHHTYRRPGLCVELMPLSYTVSPCDNENYADFSNVVREDATQYLLAAAMQ